MKQKILCAFLFFILLILYIWTNEKLSFFLLVGMVICVVGAVASNYIVGKMMKAECRIARSREKTNGVITLSFDNQSVFPIFQLKVNISVINMLTESQAFVERSFFLLPFEKKQEQIYLDSLFCGRIEMNSCVVTAKDCFGLTEVKCRVERKGHYYCYPLQKEMQSEIESYSRVQNNVMEKYLNRKGNDPTEILDIREYQRGDSVKMIHWKLSKKLGMKVVKELDMPSNQDTLVVFALQGEVTEESVHQMIEYSVSFSRNLLKMEVHHDAILLDNNGALIRNYAIESEDTLSWFEKRILDGQISLEKAAMDAYLTQKDYMSRYATVFYILEEEPTDNWLGGSVEYVIVK